MKQDDADIIEDKFLNLRIQEMKAKMEHAHSIASDIIETYETIENLRIKCYSNYSKLNEILDDAFQDVDLELDNPQKLLDDDLDKITGESDAVKETDEKILRILKAIENDRFKKMLKASLDE